MILTPAEMKAAEDAVFARGIEADALMEKAGAGIARAIRRFYPGPGFLELYLGAGNNAGDALVAARLLAPLGWQANARWVESPATASPLTKKKWASYLAARATAPRRALPHHHPVISLDGLLGIGARPGLREDYRRLTREMNRRRRDSFAATIAIDIPTGVHGITGEPEPDAVEADHTFTVCCAKAGLVADAAIRHIGRLEIIALPEILPDHPGEFACERMISPPWIAASLPRRTPDWHKGNAGRVAIVAGSPGMTGAADLASRAALRSGAGLVTLLAHESVANILAARCAPEVMVRSYSSAAEVDLFSFDSLAIGPGLGELADPWADVPWEIESRVIADADFLNALARRPGALKHFLARTDASRLLTPHPGEFRRLMPDLEMKMTRKSQVQAFTERHPGVVLLLKGARTIVSSAKSGMISYNPTGHSGMASGGMGDVLTGVCAGLAAQGMDVEEAGCAGAWLCGRAAEIAILDPDSGESRESLAAGDVIQNLGQAFRALRSEASD